MNKQKTAFQIASEIHAKFNVPVFPVRLSQSETGGWRKKPLVKWTKASGDPRDVGWKDANAVGVPMGQRSGLLTVDIDDYKPNSEASSWAEGHNLPATRTHKTASGGKHLIFRLPAGIDLGNHAPSVSGLDIRGRGGFIVWDDVGDCYSVLNDQMPVELPAAVVSELHARQTTSGRSVSDADLPDFQPVRRDALDRKLAQLLCQFEGVLLKARFEGSTVGLKDTSASGRDMAVAGLLARRGFSYDEIISVLLTLFPHGVAARDGWDPRTERLAKRCAYRATEDLQRRSERRREAMQRQLAEFRNRFRPTAIAQKGNQK